MLEVCSAPPRDLAASRSNSSIIFSGHYSFAGHTELSEKGAPLGDLISEGKDKPLALVVDDAPDVTEMVALFLRYSGYDVVEVYSGPEALDAAENHNFDVIVSDIGMPGMNGYELAQALRALPRYTAVPMIAVTGFSMYDDRGRSLQAGFNAHLTKPINPQALLDTIQRLMS